LLILKERIPETEVLHTVAAISTLVEDSLEAEVEEDTHMDVLVAVAPKDLAIGMPGQTAIMLQVTIHVDIMKMHTHGKCAMEILTDPIIGQDSRPKDSIPEAEVVVDSTADVEMDVVRMTLTKMMPVIMEAIWQLIMQPQLIQVRQVPPPR
jgi:hypothetical protein